MEVYKALDRVRYMLKFSEEKKKFNELATNDYLDIVKRLQAIGLIRLKSPRGVANMIIELAVQPIDLVEGLQDSEGKMLAEKS